MKYILLLALLAPSGDLQPYRTLTPAITERECMSLKDSPVVAISYLEDAWYGEKMPGNVVLVCVPYAGSGHAAK